tara:strand:+ start:221 stop:400 length:180 start_codon:yes stop_codon:yes gene_type:complete
LTINKFIKPRFLALWLILIDAELKPISIKEAEKAKNLPLKKLYNFNILEFMLEKFYRIF